MRVLSLFSGIGGLDLAAEWAGMEVVAFCEIEPYATKVLKRRFPDVPIFGDVFALTRDTLAERGIRPDGIDCVIGGFPCQPFSVAGRRKGAEDERFLWGEFSRLIGEIRPSWVIAENVPGIISLALDDVLADLERKGYGCLPFVYPASAVGAPHRRERVFIVAHNSKQGLQGGEASRNNVTNRPEPLDELAPRCCAGNLWPTPDCSDRRSAKSKQQGLSNKVKEIETQNWPTPSVSGNHNRRGLSEKSGDGLATAVQNWPTPNAADDRDRGNLSTPAIRRRIDKGKQIQLSMCVSDKSGQLNPDWVECLMGFPIGWTDIKCKNPQEWPGWPAPLGVNVNWATPNTMDTLPSRSFEAMKSQATNGARKNRSYPGNLREQIDPLMRQAYIEASRENGGNVEGVQVSSQYPYEPPRTTTVSRNRAKRLKCLGNAVVPQQAYPIFRAIMEVANNEH